jgi:hypothetical protein
MLSGVELERRRPVWIALSELWLDTELEEADLRYIAAVMKDSAYDPAQLRAIYLYEVAPVVYRNLLMPAGEWNGFDADWLVAEIERRIRGRSFIGRLLIRLRQRPMTCASEAYWRRLERMLHEMLNE